jgi:hypothetical protein
MVESCKLSMLSRLSLTLPLDILEWVWWKIVENFWQRYRSASPELCLSELDLAISEWRQGLPSNFRVSSINEEATTTSWILSLITRSYVCECIMFRMISRSTLSEHSTKQRADERLRSALFEANTTIDRIMNQSTGRFNTWLL